MPVTLCPPPDNAFLTCYICLSPAPTQLCEPDAFPARLPKDGAVPGPEQGSVKCFSGE